MNALVPYSAGDKPGEAEPRVKGKDWPEIHSQAMEEYERDYEKERRNIAEAYSDLRFRRGELEDQWDSVALAQRKGRPTHVINEIPQFVRQITGDQRQSKPSIKVVPVDDNADPDTAEVLAGIVRYIENRSYAQYVYTSAADSQVACGIGHWRINTEYASSTTFNQEIRIAGVDDGVSVLWDADATLPTREDANRCFVPNDMSLAKFKASWPDAKADGFEIRSEAAFTNWHGDDYIRVVEYWKKKPIKRSLVLMPDGAIEDVTAQTDGFGKAQLAAAHEYYAAIGARFEQRDGFKICRYLMTSAEILEETDWPGLHIPIVPVVGEEVRIGRDVYRHGIVRYMKEPQRMANYYASAETEVIALQPKAPWIGTRKNFEKDYDLWDTANTENHPFLQFTPDASNPAGPQRVQPPVASQAIIAGRQKASDMMRAVVGIYDASLGARSNETSGVAIRARDAQGDTGTYVYHANFALAIQRTGQILVDLAPHIYDTERTMRIIGDDGKPSTTKINHAVMKSGEEVVQNDITVGSYDVMTMEGPSYATRRDEARDGLTEFIRAFPAAAPVLGDVYAKMQNWPDADKIGERLEELLPAPIKAKLKQERKDPNAPPEPPTPEEQQAAEEGQIKQAVTKLELEGKSLDNDKKRAEIAKTMKEVQAPAEGAAPNGYDDALQAIEIEAKHDDLLTKRRLNELTIQIKEAELAKARIGLVASGEKHVLDVAKSEQSLSHAEDGHSARMSSAAQNMAHSEERQELQRQGAQSESA